jgi:hypothetical protein
MISLIVMDLPRQIVTSMWNISQSNSETFLNAVENALGTRS